MQERVFGKTQDGDEVILYTIANSKGMKAEIINYGGIVVSLYVPDEDQKQIDVVLGCDNLEDYQNSPFFGAIVGRHANRIEGAVFELNKKEYKLVKNDGNNHLHGGTIGFDKVIWDVIEHNENTLKLHYLSVDGEEVYPGNLDVTVTYSITEDNGLSIEYTAKSDADTVINLTNHSYFNLSGHNSGDILNHQLKINADKFTFNNEECIPTGEILSVEGTPMDFRDFRTIEPGIKSDSIHIKNGGGYDHNFVLNVSGKEPEFAAELFDPSSNRRMKVYTTKPGIQFYSGNSIGAQVAGKDGAIHSKWSGLCLETQFFPNAMKHKHFPSPILRAGELYHHITIYKFE